MTMGQTNGRMSIGAMLSGMISGAQPVLGFNYGAKLIDRVKKGFWFCVKGSFGFLFCVALLHFFTFLSLVSPFLLIHFFIMIALKKTNET